ncbi:uncharacterized protein LOC121401172 [Xenopus laevis]|uniref:Uncharacterized protein LOC121401172 n=1 Tax=Xenopus laevis TaxID=8355 RepID=A0A8J1MJ80_XENLA|nr:uncharacterized protein LOC121401172 [Xenopus laevis]
MPEPNTQMWEGITENFYRTTQFPNCLGALDGKHIRIRKPPRSGSKFFNYKKYFSIVLLALVDSNYKFIAIDVGAYGSTGDSRIFKNSVMGRHITSGRMKFPNPKCLPGGQIALPHVLVADEAFASSQNILKPYPQRGLDIRKRVYNYRLSRARRMVECAFGILANKWRILHTSIQLDVKHVDMVIKACCVLHNFLRLKDRYFSFDDMCHNLTDVHCHATRSTIHALQIRDHFADFFLSPEGEVHWQYHKM